MFKYILLVNMVMMFGEIFAGPAASKVAPKPVIQNKVSTALGFTVAATVGIIVHHERQYRRAIGRLHKQHVSEALLLRTKFQPHGPRATTRNYSNRHSPCEVCGLSATAENSYSYALISRAKIGIQKKVEEQRENN